MRELVLNEASFPRSATVSRRTAAAWLTALASGIAMLVSKDVVASRLRTRTALSQILCGAGVSLDQRFRELLSGGHRDDAMFLMKLNTKSPLLTELGNDVVDRFRGCEVRDLEAPYGEALVLCAHLGAVAAGVPSTKAWDRDFLMVRFDELLPNGTVDEVPERIDHVARSSHAARICASHVNALRSRLDLKALWSERSHAFPNLMFGPDVEGQISGMVAAMLPTVVNRLAQLDASAGAWGQGGGPAPNWMCRVTPESRRVMASGRLRQARVFRSAKGRAELFDWHARFGNNGRIHLRFTPSTREVEIGYIGPHLPL